MQTRRISVVVILSSALWLTGIVSAAGAQGIEFGLRPEDQTKGYFQFTARPGDSISDAVLAVNASASAQPLEVLVADGETMSRGGIGFSSKSAESAKWIQMPDSGKIEVPAANGSTPSALRLPFTVRVPINARPGEYVFGFVATLLSKTQSSGGFTVQVVPQAAVTVIITVPGSDPAPKIAVEKVAVYAAENQAWHIGIALKNAGALGWRGKGTLALKTGAGTVFSEPLNIGYFISNDSIEYPIYPTIILPPGSYTAEVSLNDEGGAAVATYSQPITLSSIQPTATPQVVLSLPTFTPAPESSTAPSTSTEAVTAPAAASAVAGETPIANNAGSEVGAGGGLSIWMKALIGLGGVALLGAAVVLRERLGRR